MELRVSPRRKRLRRRLENEPQTKKRFDKLNDQLIQKARVKICPLFFLQKLFVVRV